MVLKLFRADWCHACHTALPAAREVARSLELPLEVVDVDGDAGRAERAALGVRMLPTLALVDDGRVRFRVAGSMIDPESVARIAALAGARAPDPAQVGVGSPEGGPL